MLFRVTLFLYFIATLHAALYFLSQKEIIARIVSLAVNGGFLAHTVWLLARGINGGYFPVSNLFEGLSFFSWAVVLTYILIQLRFRIPILASFVIPVPFLFLLYSINFSREFTPLHDPQLQSFWLFFHVLGAFAGYAGAVLCFAAGMMYVLQDKALKHRKSGVMMYRLPSLDVLDRISSIALTIGFPGMTLALVSGTAWALSTWDANWFLDTKVILSAGLWALYGVLIYLRMVRGVRGRSIAIASMVGFAVIVVTFVGLSILAAQGILPSVHSFL